MEFENLPNEEQDRYIQLSTELLDGQLYCTRTWEAWHYKTMSENDFFNSNEDDDLVYDNAKRIYNFLKSRFRGEKINKLINEND